jgi:membrane protease YdiL (CAAX protease family)
MALPVFLLVGAGFEEVLLRGYIWNRLEQLTRPECRLLVSSLLFASYHPHSIVQATDVFVGGVLFGAFYWRGRSVPRLVLAHFAINLATYY